MDTQLDLENIKSRISVLESTDPNKWMKDVEDILGYDLFYTFSAIFGMPEYKDEMFLGVDGLPLTTVSLIEIGLFFINDNYVELDPGVKKIVIAKKIKLEQLLESLQARVDRQPKN